MKNLTDFRKTVETSVDPRLSVHFFICLWLTNQDCKLALRFQFMYVPIVLAYLNKKKTAFPLLST